MQRFPSATPSSTLPSPSTISGLTLKNGNVADPGLVAMAPGSGEIMMPPVSVCHQVSTTGVLFAPIHSRYQIHASGFIGSPTVPSNRSDDRSWRAGYSEPHFMKVRIAVGAVYRI